jgi:hypothetical protein
VRRTGVVALALLIASVVVTVVLNRRYHLGTTGTLLASSAASLA